MRAQDLKLTDLFEFKPEEGVIRFREGRVLMIDAESIGRLRELMLRFLGKRATMALLSQYGYTTGYYDAIKLKNLYPWDTEVDWIASGPMMHMLEGIVHVTPNEITFDREKRIFNMHGVWRNSYEAEQHRHCFGVETVPVCWTLTGYASGYATAFMGFDCICIEEKCVGQGDDHCYWHLRKREDWGDEAKTYVESLELLTTRSDDFYALMEEAIKAKRR